jgi:competence protein ComEA
MPRRGEEPARSSPPLNPRSIAALGGALLLAAAAVYVATSSLAGTSVDAAAAPGGSPPASSSDGIGQLVVDVAGAVLRPGVYRLAAGSRIADAIAAAAGFAPRVDAARVAAELNLAALVHDGDRILVPGRGDASASPAGPGDASKPGLIDLNRATAEQLDALPGIGPVTAAKIVASRAGQPFRSVDELRSRGLVGEKTFEQLKSLVTVG